ncbi:hypothetical protein IX51_02060 [uncultured archaeon]|nr:hypothetical protein IX51_02060 [uncultured archaeon]
MKNSGLLEIMIVLFAGTFQKSIIPSMFVTKTLISAQDIPSLHAPDAPSKDALEGKGKRFNDQ